MPSAPISRESPLTLLVCRAVNVVQPITTGMLPRSSATAISATRRRSASDCENHSPVVPFTRMPWTPYRDTDAIPRATHAHRVRRFA